MMINQKGKGIKGNPKENMAGAINNKLHIIKSNTYFIIPLKSTKAQREYKAAVDKAVKEIEELMGVPAMLKIYPYK